MTSSQVNHLATAKQIAYLGKLILSSAIKSEDAQRVSAYLQSGRATMQRVSAGIEWAKGQIDAQAAAKDASATRKAQYHQAKATRPFRTAKASRAVAENMRRANLRSGSPGAVLFD